ncbi:hypothetical protein ABZ807_18550 [Micromonospora sp. NPDC047548]|uniref:hypothetical protein n=1 Tax=Micromonospora sp. NPDC047548 TaxID=3155624 RepID=UPI0033D04D7F
MTKVTAEQLATARGCVLGLMLGDAIGGNVSASGPLLATSAGQLATRIINRVTEKLHQLAALLRARDDLDTGIAVVTGRSARQGDIGEFIAAQVFDIELAGTATHAGHDGTFKSGPLAGRTVNVKTYGDAFTGIDISPHPCDFYLVFSGPPRPLGTVRHHRWQIAAAYLLDTRRLLETLSSRGVKIGIATSIRRADLEAAQIFPDTNPDAPLRLASEQAALLALFAEGGPVSRPILDVDDDREKRREFADWLKSGGLDVTGGTDAA